MGKNLNLLGIQKEIIEKEAELKNEIKSLEKNKKKKLKLNEILKDHQEALIIVQKASKLTQEHLSRHLAGIVTKALATVFEEKYKFKIEWVERRNSTEADFKLFKNGRERAIFGSSGFGIADIISFALRVAYVLLLGKRKLLILDEPFRHLDVYHQPYAAHLVNQLAEELDIKFIISTHHKDFANECKSLIKVINKNDTAKVKVN